jgi:hypothetical protein
MNDDGDTKDDVRMPEGEVGEKIIKLFKTDEKDTSMSAPYSSESSSWKFVSVALHNNIPQPWPPITLNTQHTLLCRQN